MGAKVGEFREVPGTRTRQRLEEAKRLFFTTTVTSDLVIEMYDGAYCYDPDGNRYFDLASGVGVASFGGGDAIKHIWDMMGELRKRCGACGDIGTDWYNTTMTDAARYIVPRFPLASNQNKIFFTHSGTQANEAALKLAWSFMTQANPERTAIVVLRGAFHGRTGYTIKLLDPRKAVRQKGFPMPNYDVLRAPFPSASLKFPRAGLKDFFAGISPRKRQKVAAIIFEPVQGEGGICVPYADALQWWVDIWREEGALIACDEVQAGIARTGKLMSYEHFGIRPDIVTVGKHFGSGVPIAAMVGPAWADWTEVGRHAESFQGSPLTAAAAHATMRHVVEHGVVARNAELGEFLREELEAKIRPLRGVKEIRGVGLMQGVELTREPHRNRTVEHAERHGLRILGAGFSDNPTIRIMPTFVATRDQISEAINVLKRSIIVSR